MREPFHTEPSNKSQFDQDVERRFYEGEDPLYFRTPTLLIVPTRKLVHEFEAFGSGVGTCSMRRYDLKMLSI